MGKADNKSEKDDDSTAEEEDLEDKKKESSEEDEPSKPAEVEKPEREEDEDDTKPSKVKTPKREKDEEETSNDKKDTDSIRKVIKLDESGEEETEEKKKEKGKERRGDGQDSNKTNIPNSVDDLNLDSSSDKKALEQKRALLQSIKDFDFQIKKNQENIDTVNQKLESMSKDLDDLVSLYEIVSEQMNPFVGISKVTKKRLDALENFTKEIDELKERTNELESFAVRSGGKFKSIDHEKTDGETIETESSLEGVEDQASLTEEESSENIPDEETYDEVTTEIEPSNETVSWNHLSDNEIDRIIERSLGSMSLYGRIDMVIDNFIENLKG